MRESLAKVYKGTIVSRILDNLVFRAIARV